MRRFLVLLISAGVLATAASASSFKLIKKVTNPNFQKLVDVLGGFTGKYVGSGTYAVTKPTAAHGRTAAQLRVDILKEALHRYSGAMLDEGIRLDKVPMTSAGVDSALSVLNQEEDDGYPMGALKKALLGLTGEKTLVIYAGDGGGNNTMAELLCVYDTSSDQIAYLIFSNFGSDD